MYILSTLKVCPDVIVDALFIFYKKINIQLLITELRKT